MYLLLTQHLLYINLHYFTTSYYPISALLICQVVAYRRLKTKENFKLLALTVVTVPNERWSLTTGSKCSDLTWKLLVMWKTGRSGDYDVRGHIPVLHDNLFQSILSFLSRCESYV